MRSTESKVRSPLAVTVFFCSIIVIKSVLILTQPTLALTPSFTTPFSLSFRNPLNDLDLSMSTDGEDSLVAAADFTLLGFQDSVAISECAVSLAASNQTNIF